MAQSKVLLQNTLDVNKVLVKSSGISITILYALSFGLYSWGMMPLMTWQELITAAVSTYVVYGTVLLLYRVKKIRPYFSYLFPLMIYLAVAIGITFFKATMATYFVWVLPILYAGLYAHRGAMLLTSILVFVTAPVHAYFMDLIPLNDILTASVVMLLIALRLISMVGRSRALIAHTEQEMEKNLLLQQENQVLLKEVASTSEEVHRVVEQLTRMTGEIRQAMAQIAAGSEEMMASSQDSHQVLERNRNSLAAQVEKSDCIGQATREAVTYADHVRTQAQAGREVVAEIVSVIEKIDEQTADTTDRSNRLFEQADEISAFSEEIASIAKNVTVVAINASIEAARAGAAGRTFQVVAQQVQQLAHQTSQAAESIGELAQRIQSELSQINRNMSQNREVIAAGVEISKEATEKLHQIGEAVEGIRVLMGNIAQDVERQHQEAMNIASGMEELRLKTQKNLAHIEAAAASTEETAAIMDDYATVVERLRERAEALHVLLRSGLKE